MSTAPGTTLSFSLDTPEAEKVATLNSLGTQTSSTRLQ